jgi:hypothetical protein
MALGIIGGCDIIGGGQGAEGGGKKILKHQRNIKTQNKRE